MDGMSLLAEARASGLEVRADGDRLVVRGPRQAEAVALRLLERKADVLPLVAIPAASLGWNPEMARLIGWFLATEPPAAPFELQRGVMISHPARYWAYLNGDIAVGPGKGRGFTGAFQADLRQPLN